MHTIMLKRQEDVENILKEHNQDPLDMRQDIIDIILWVNAVSEAVQHRNKDDGAMNIGISGNPKAAVSKCIKMSMTWLSCMFTEFAPQAQDLLTKHLRQLEAFIDAKTVVSSNSRTLSRRWKRRYRQRTQPHYETVRKALKDIHMLQISGILDKGRDMFKSIDSTILKRLKIMKIIPPHVKHIDFAMFPAKKLAMHLAKRGAPLDREMVRRWWRNKTPMFTPDCCIPNTVTTKMLVMQFVEFESFSRFLLQMLVKTQGVNNKEYESFLKDVRNIKNMGHIPVHIWWAIFGENPNTTLEMWRQHYIECT